MLIRISLIVAIIAGLAVGVLNFVQVKEKITNLRDQRDSEARQKVEAQTDLAKTREDLANTERDLKRTQDTLTETAAERDRAVAEASAQSRRATQLASDLERTRADLNRTSGELQAYVLTGFTPAQILGLGKQITDLQTTIAGLNAENDLLARKLLKTEVELAKLVDKDFHVPLPANLRGTVLAADPKWDFVVLDFGEDQRALKDAELLVSRDGKLVGKLRIHSVDKNRSVANVVAGWRIGDVTEGDVVIPAYPKS